MGYLVFICRIVYFEGVVENGLVARKYGFDAFGKEKGWGFERVDKYFKVCVGVYVCPVEDFADGEDYWSLCCIGHIR